VSALAVEDDALFPMTRDELVRRALTPHVKTIYGMGTPRGRWCFQIAEALLDGTAIPKPPGRPNSGVADRITAGVTSLLRDAGLL
jgi:hypothetical protein